MCCSNFKERDTTLDNVMPKINVVVLERNYLCTLFVNRPGPSCQKILKSYFQSQNHPNLSVFVFFYLIMSIYEHGFFINNF